MVERIIVLLMLWMFSIGNIYSNSDPELRRQVLQGSKKTETPLHFKSSSAYGKHPHILECYIEAVSLNNSGKTKAALQKFTVALELSQNEMFAIGIIDAKFAIGKIYYNWGEFDKSLLYFLDARKYAQMHDYKPGLANVLNYIGKYYHSKGGFKKSFQLFNQGLEVALACSDSASVSELYSNIGNYYETTGNISKALQYYLKALEYTNAENDPLNLASVHNHLGTVYQLRDDFSDAMYHHCIALKYREKNQYMEGVGKSIKNIGELFEDQNVLDSAQYYYQKALVIFETVDYRKGIVKCHNNLGRIETDRKVALNHLKQAMSRAGEMGYVKGLVNAGHALSGFYSKYDQYDSSRIYLDKALMLARQNNMKRHEKNILFDYYKLEQILGRHNAALKKYIGYSDVKDQINNKASELYFEELQLAFKMRNKEKQNKILKTENELKTLLIERKNLMIVVSILVIVLLVGLIILTYINLDRNKKANIQLQQFNREISDKNKSLIELNEKLKNVNNEKDKLYSIMVHELRNPLQWFRQITGMLNKKYDQMSPDKLKRTLHVLDDSANQAYHLMDNLLQWTRSQLGRVKCNPEPIMLSEAIKDILLFAQSAVSIKNIKLDVRGNTSSKILFDKVMFQTVLRNFISNAIKFTPSGGEIYVVALLDAKNKVKVEVHDSGVGIHSEYQSLLFNPDKKFTTEGLMQEKGSGLGLLICKEFIEMNDGLIIFESKSGVGSVFGFVVDAI